MKPTEPAILSAKVMHKRLIPKVNQFVYRVYNLAIPLQAIPQLADGRRFGLNRAGIMSFWEKDHGPRDGSDLNTWIRNILQEHAIEPVAHIMLVTMPRVFGYGFNPVSFWLCLDERHRLRAVLCAVSNTFGEHHDYLCAHADGRPITAQDWLEAEKVFHVSPFIEREGYYRFRFDFQPENDRLGIWIDYYNAAGEKLLLTSIVGSFSPYHRRSRARAFWSHPLLTLMVIGRIHWQAIRLLRKRVRYIVKPAQREPRRTSSSTLAN